MIHVYSYLFKAFTYSSMLWVVFQVSTIRSSAQVCNRVSFHDFEESNFAEGWLARDGVNPAPSGLSQTDSAVISGSYAAKLQVLGTGASINNRPRTFSLEAGKFYTLSFWIRASDSARVKFGILKDSTFFPVLLDSVDVLLGWQEVAVEFQAPADWPYSVLVFAPVFEGARGAYDLFLDYVTLCEREQSETCNLATIPGFESLTYTAAWSHYDGGEPGSSFMFLENEDVYSGRFSAKLSVNYFGGSGAYLSTASRAYFEMDSNSYYTFSCWMKSDVDSARVRTMVNRRTPYRELNTEYFVLDTVWRKYTMSFQAPVYAPQAYIRFIAKNAYLSEPYHVFIDDVRLCKSDIPDQLAPGGVSEGLLFWVKGNEGPNARSVSTWLDQSSSQDNLISTGTSPRRIFDLINQNAAVNLNSSNDRMVRTAMDLAGRANQHAWYIVLRGNNATPSATPFALYENGYRLETNAANQWSVAGTLPERSQSIPADANAWNIIQANSSPSQFRMYLNGRGLAVEGPLSGLDEGDSTLIGAKAVDNSNWWAGDIAEIIVYKNAQNASERAKINTYLSLKYGISIPISQHLYYSFSSHPHNMAGIGQDEALMGFRQTKSRNIQAGSIVSISRPTRLNDGDYLVWGHDNTSLSNSNQVPSGVINRVNRSWRVAHTGEIGKVSVGFDLAEMGLTPGYGYALLVDKDGNFSNAEVVGQPYLNDTEIGFTGITLSDGDFFSLAKVNNPTVPKAPGRIDDGLSLWLEAEEGPNSNSLSFWQDLSPHSNSAVAFDEGPRREWDQINGNPAIEFTQFRNRMMGASDLNLAPNAHTYYVVLNSTGTRNWTNPLTVQENGYRLEINGSSRNYSIYGLEPGGINSTAPSAQWSMISISSRSDGYGIFENGNLQGSRSVRDGLQGDGPYFIGARNRNASSWYQGKIAEVVVYAKEQDEASRHAVETYLAVKYGISLPVASHLFYAHDSHPYAIAGIGRDSQQKLWQDNSKSIDSSAIVSISNPSGLGEGEYLVWGHDGDSLARSENVPPAVNQRFTRSWKVSRTGNPGSVWVAFELAGLGIALSDASEFSLLIDTDTDFSDAIVRNNGAFEGSKLIFKGVQFADGNTFGLAVSDRATSIDLPSELLSLNLYPNPGQDVLNLSFETRKPGHLKLEVYDFQGRLLFQQALQGNQHQIQVNTSLWPQGLYFVKLSEGGVFISKTWMKQR